MFDCANVEMRELLPELAAGTLDASARLRVEAHVRTCAECASELETLRAVRGAFAAIPTIDTRRIIAALPKPPASVEPRPSVGAPVKRWVDWRVAAALTMITVGGLSLAVTQRRGNEGASVVPFDSATMVTSPDSQTGGAVDSSVGVASAGRTDTGNGTPRRSSTPRVDAKAQLSVNGGVSDLDDASLKALLGALDEIDRAPVAPSAEPDRSSVLPVIKGDDR
jgi:anti-sigma factor RsiW